MSAPDPVFHLKNFENLLYDAAYLLYLSADIDRETDEDGTDSTLARGSILSSLLLFECAANCSIDVLKLRGSYANDIDKLPFLSKFEFYLSERRPRKRFDRGCSVVQAVSELKRLRDDYVHPKVQKKLWEPDDDGGFTVEFPKTNQLGLSVNPGEWRCPAAVSALKAATSFFDLYFLDWCEFDSNTVCEILLMNEPASIPSRASIAIDGVGGLNRAMSHWGVSFRFLGKCA